MSVEYSHMPKEPSVAVILLNWNNWSDTVECLESLKNVNYENFSVTIVDNNSKNDSIKKLREYANGNIDVSSEYFDNDSGPTQFDLVEYTNDEVTSTNFETEIYPTGMDKVSLIQNDKNYGFPEGNNIGIKYSQIHNPDYYLLLNNDTAVDPEFITELVKTAEQREQAGIVGSIILDYEDPSLVQSFGGKVHWWLGGITKVYGGQIDAEEYSDTVVYSDDQDEFSKVKEREYTWATSMLISDEVVEDIGYLDSEFFFGIEEYDYCRRASNNGFKIFVTPYSKVWHKKGGSWKFLEDDMETREEIRNSKGPLQWKFYYKLFKKHLPPVVFIFPFILRMGMTIISRFKNGARLKRAVPGVK